MFSYANVGATSLFTTAGDLTQWIENFAAPRVGSSAVIEQMLERGRLDSGAQLPAPHCGDEQIHAPRVRRFAAAYIRGGCDR